MDDNNPSEQDKPVINDVVSTNQVVPNATSRPLVLNAQPTTPDSMVNKSSETINVTVATPPTAAPVSAPTTVPTASTPTPAPAPANTPINEVTESPVTASPAVLQPSFTQAEGKEHKVLLLIVFVILLVLIAGGVLLIKLNKQ